MLGGFLSGLFIWNHFREYEPTAIVVEAEPTATLRNPKVSTVLSPTATTVIEPTEETPEVYLARLSHYTPDKGPPSCIAVNWQKNAQGKYECVSQLFDGKIYRHWSYYKDWGMACPPYFPRGTKMIVGSNLPDGGFGVWTCIDRGSAIVALEDEHSTFFIDLMTDDIPYVHNGSIIRDRWSPHGSYVVEVTVLK
jgi:hypothetical protein